MLSQLFDGMRADGKWGGGTWIDFCWVFDATARNPRGNIIEE